MGQQPWHFLIGTQQDGEGQGIHHGLLDPATGDMRLIGLAAQVRRPTWLHVDARNRRLFAVSETGNKGECPGEVLSFAMAGTKAPLGPLGRASAVGGGTTHLCQSPAGDVMFAANFGGGQAARVPVLPGGGLGPATLSAAHEGSGPHPRQNRPHPHGVTLSPDGRFLLVPDMGNDQVVVHPLDGDGFAAAGPAVCRFPAGSGPRLLLFGPSGRRAYLLTELSAELFVLDWDSQAGTLAVIDRCPLDQPQAEGAPSAAALLLSPDGRFLHASNRRSATLCTFAIDPSTGAPTLVQSLSSGGDRPWGAGMSPDGRWLLVANQASGTVVAFHRSIGEGTLSPVDAAPLEVDVPTHIAFAPAD